MRKWILITLVLAVMLAGCSNERPETTTAPTGDTTMSAGETTAPALMPGLLDPDHALTAQTGGAVVAYPLEEGEYTGILPVAEGLLLVSNDYFGDTILTLLSGETGAVAARRDLNTLVDFGSALWTMEGGVHYFDTEDRTLVTLDPALQELSRVTLPEDMEGTPVISMDGTEVYYHTGTQIRVMTLKTGISRLLRDQGDQVLGLEGLYCDDTVLKIHLDDSDETMATQYLSTRNGGTVHYGDDTLSLETYGEMFCAELGVDYNGELIFGQIGGEVKSLQPVGNNLWTRWLPAMGGSVNCVSGDGTWTMNYYDLASGQRTSSVTLSDSGTAYGMTEDMQGNIWFLYEDQDTRQAVLCRWDLTRSAVSDSQIYTGRRYTADHPDTAGLAACAEEAKRIGEAYGVEILLWQDVMALQPEDYSFRAEHRVSAVESGLQTLEQALARYPEGFLQKAAEHAESGKIRICLVGGIYSTGENGAVSGTDGIQYWLGSDPCIALRLSDTIEMSFYHQMCHIIESHVLGNTVTYDDWEKLNPRDFEYDYDYTENRNRTDTKYLEGENRAFVDFYSMSYPKEDRARIMEYAMMEGNEEVFASEWMQRKLLRLCRGIRKAFKLSKYGEVLPWEVYLETSLVP